MLDIAHWGNSHAKMRGLDSEREEAHMLIK